MTKQHSTPSRNALPKAKLFLRAIKHIKHSWSSSHLVIWSSLIPLTACGFEPMSATSTASHDQRGLPASLAAVSITTDTPADRRRIGEEFRITLEDLINPGQRIETGSSYQLNVSLTPIASPGLIAPDGKAQRYLVSMNSSYTLTAPDGSIIERGQLNRNSSYSNLPNSYYSTYIAEQDTMKRLSRELAEQYRMKLASLLANPPSAPSAMPEASPAIQYLNPTATFDLPTIIP